jgi:hypothetical protein
MRDGEYVDRLKDGPWMCYYANDSKMMNEEMGCGRPSDASGYREAKNGPHSQSQADRLPHSGKPED